MSKTWITTVSGKRFYFDEPEFDIRDIAHALSNICRFTGHTKSAFSVAQHSVLVAEYLSSFSKEVRFAGLMHDASEAYLGDMSHPLKATMADYAAMESFIEKRLEEHFGYSKHPAVKWADEVLLATEVRDVLGVSSVGWGLKYQPMRDKIRPWSSFTAKNIFLHYFGVLK